MKYTLRKFLPLIVGFGVLVVFMGYRAYSMSKLNADGQWPDVDGGTYSEPVTKGGVKYLVPPDELYENGLGKDGIPALTAPKYVTAVEADVFFDDQVEGIAVEVNGRHRFYSFQVLNWHEAVNDDFEGKKLLVTYSTLCGSAAVYDRAVEGTLREFGGAGVVYNNCSVLYDKSSDSLWNQTTGQAIVGIDAGKMLERYPSTVMRWDTWRNAHRDGEVLSAETGFVRDYRRHPLASYDTDAIVLFPLNKVDTSMATKELVRDVVHDGVHYGFVSKFILSMTEPNVTLGEGEGAVNLVAFVDENGQPRLFDRRVDGRTLTFMREANQIRDKETGSRWNENGIAMSGSLRGKGMTEFFPTARYFAFAYSAHFPEATVVGRTAEDEAVIEAEPIEINVGE